MQGEVPPLDPRPLRSMADMGMGDMGGMTMNHDLMPGMRHGTAAPESMPAMPGMDHSAMPGMGSAAPGGMPMDGNTGTLKESVEVDNVAMMPTDRLNEPARG